MLQQLLAHGVGGGPFDADINIFCVFAVNHHIKVLGAFMGAWGAAVITAGPHTGIEIKDLPKGNV